MTSRIIRALLVSVICAATGLAVSCWFWSSPVPYANYAYQEFSTSHPEQGFEYVVGYTGSQAFFWDELIASRNFKFLVLKKSGETPQKKWGLIPSISAQRYVTFDRSKKESLYLMLTFTSCDQRAEYYRQSIVRDFTSISNAFVEASHARGVDIVPIGEVSLFTSDLWSWRAVLKRNWVPYLILCCGTGAMVAFFSSRKKDQPNVTATDNLRGVAPAVSEP
jgi:hypothetical protein